MTVDDDGNYRENGQQHQHAVQGARGPAPMVVALQWHQFSRLCFNPVHRSAWCPNTPRCQIELHARTSP
jgi:hypothetical protein